MCVGALYFHIGKVELVRVCARCVYVGVHGERAMPMQLLFICYYRPNELCAADDADDADDI